jgi:hypothetical protein
MDNHALVPKIVEFLKSIGLDVQFSDDLGDTFLPGVAIRKGTLAIDQTKLLYPGDLLHEGGHLALLPAEQRRAADGNMGDDGWEMAVLAWSYAAALHLEIAPEVVFHDTGYKGGAAALRENFAAGRYIGVPLLKWAAMTSEYPRMKSWLREC